MPADVPHLNKTALSAVLVTGAGIAFLSVGLNNFSLQVILTGGPTAAIVTLEATNDGGVTWFVIGTWSKAAPLTSGDIVFVVDKPVKSVRANLTTLTNGTNPTVSAYVVGVP